jgi:hypothetical protein
MVVHKKKKKEKEYQLNNKKEKNWVRSVGLPL